MPMAMEKSLLEEEETFWDILKMKKKQEKLSTVMDI